MDDIKKKIKEIINSIKKGGSGAQDIQKRVTQFLGNAKAATRTAAKKMGMEKQFDEAEKLAKKKQLELQKQIKEIEYQKITKNALSTILKYAGQVVADIAKSTSAPPAAGGSPRAMRFPYTFTAKIVQFPWMFYIKNNWVYRYYAMALVLSFPVFKKINDVVHSPGSLAKWEDYKQKEREEHEHRFD